MRFILFIGILIYLNPFSAQNTCEMGFITDSMFVENDNSYILADGLITPYFKSNSQIKIFKVRNNYFLMIFFNSNTYFDVVSDLEIKSGSKSMYLKNIKQYQKNKHTAFFIIEVYKNYIATLKDEGITSFVFNKIENLLLKQEVKEVKKIANCFYQTINLPTTKK